MAEEKASATALQCVLCNSGEVFKSRNKLFAHLKVCSVDRNPSGAPILSDDDLFATDPSINFYLCTAGGRVRGKTLQNGEIYDLKNDSWASIPNITDHRGSHASAAIGQYFYILGGGGIDSNLTSIERYDITSNTWQKMAPMPSARHALNAVTIDGRIYVVGGWVYGTVCCAALEIYDPDSDSWSTGLDLPTPRRLMGVASHGSRIYCFGGNIGKDDQWTSDALDIYDTTTNTWTVGKKLPIAGQCSAVSSGDFVYVASHGNHIYRYDPTADTYTQISFQLPLPQWFGFDICAFNYSLYLLGGATGGRFSKQLWRYDIIDNSWKKCAEMKQERRRCSAAIITVNASLLGIVESSNEVTELIGQKRKIDEQIITEEDNGVEEDIIS